MHSHRELPGNQISTLAGKSFHSALTTVLTCSAPGNRQRQIQYAPRSTRQTPAGDAGNDHITGQQREHLAHMLKQRHDGRIIFGTLLPC